MNGNKQNEPDAFIRVKSGKIVDQSVHDGMADGIYELRLWGTANQAPAGAQGGFSWATGEPPKGFKEWFIAKLDNGQRVVLKRLPEDFTYDYTTADETYYAKRRIAKWMQFPDSEFVNLNPSPAAAQSWELDEETAKLLADLILANDDPTPVTLSVGFIKEDDGKIKHGLRVYESEYPEEGAILLSESTPVSQQTPAAAIAAAEAEKAKGDV